MKSKEQKNQKYKVRKFEGITLISLVITIIILIIIAGIAINLTLGENGLFNKAKYAKEETNKQAATEKINLKIATVQINNYAEKQEMPTLKELSLALKQDNEIDYVTEKSQIASTKYEVSEEPTSIFTKLKEYSYEFEINSSLQLAGINGIKVGKNEVDYSDSKNEVILTKKVQTKPNVWTNNIEGPKVTSGTWLIWIGICDETNTSHHKNQLGGTGCFTVEVSSTYAGINSINGYYKGEETNLTARIANNSNVDREYTITFKALKLSDTY